MSHILQTSKLDDDAALFALTLGPANRTSIALCGGSQRGFADVSLLYGVWHQLRLPVSLIIPVGLERFMPSGVPLAVSDDIRLKNQLPTAWQLIDSAGLVVVGPNMQLTSAQQVFYTRLLPKINVPTVITAEALSLWTIEQSVRDNSKFVWLLSCEQVEKMMQADAGKINRARGIFGVAEYLQQLPVKSDFIMLYDDMNLYSYVTATDTLIHTPLQGSERLARDLVLSLLPVTVFARSQGIALQEKLKVLHALFAQIGGQSIGTPESWSTDIKRLLA